MSVISTRRGLGRLPMLWWCVSSSTSSDLVRQGRPRSDSLRPTSSGYLQCFSHLCALNELPCMLSAGHPEHEDGYKSLLARYFNRLKGNAKRKRTKATDSFEVCGRPHPPSRKRET